MKQLLLIIPVVLAFSCRHQTFVVEEVPDEMIETERPDFESKDTSLYKIRFDGDTMAMNVFWYPMDSPGRSLDTLRAIEDLLSFEGDKRLCVVPIRCYNPLTSQIYMGSSEYYSIQLEALFIINQLFYKKPFFYSPFPVLIERTNLTTHTVDGPIIHEAFARYKHWFEVVRTKGLDQARKENIDPLANCNIMWL